MTDLVTKEEQAISVLDQYSDMIEKINLEELPTIIDNQIALIDDLGEKIENALMSAEAAKSSAEEAKNESASFGHKKKAIEKLQESGQKSADAIGETVDALKVSFEYERELGEISKFLIAIAACSSVHTERSIERINNAIQSRQSNKPLNNVAKERLQQIINQMKAQSEAIKRMEERDAQDEVQDKQIKEMAEDDDRQDALIQDLQQKVYDLKKWVLGLSIVSAFTLLLVLLQILGLL